MRTFLGATLLILSCGTFAAQPLPTTSSLGISELPIRDAAEFVITPSYIAAVRSADSVAGIPGDFALEADGFWRQTFKVPDGKVMVITQLELQDVARTSAWLEQTTTGDPDTGWILYSAYVSLDFQGAAKPLTPLTTPLVLAPGRTFRLHTNAPSVSARGYYLEETTSQ